MLYILKKCVKFIWFTLDLVRNQFTFYCEPSIHNVVQYCHHLQILNTQ